MRGALFELVFGALSFPLLTAAIIGLMRMIADEAVMTGDATLRVVYPAIRT